MMGIVALLYMIAVFCFAWGIRMLRHPKTAKNGNLLSGTGMLIGILTALIQPLGEVDNNYFIIVGSMVVGGAIGWPLATRVQMTAMPQLVALFNGLGGASALTIGIVEIVNITPATPVGSGIVSVLALIIGSVTFTGSVLAYMKLEGTLRKQWVVPMHNVWNIVILIALAILSAMIISQGGGSWLLLFLLVLLALFYGVFFVFPIGGADMPVVIALLNSLSGLSAAAAGAIFGNQTMLIGGILVGASGTILTLLMCQAMNRSIWNVILAGRFKAGSGAVADGDQVMKEITRPDAAILLQYSKKVMVIPGYGLAVSQAQKTVKELDDLLNGLDVHVQYAIHPVAGRMPGHMNVLLAEANVPYEKLLDLDDANAALKDTDVVIVIGANDVVNPSANDDPSSPIYGMPILNATDARHVIVMKRGRGTGYSGIENPLFFHDKTQLYFGDAKASLQEIITELKENI